MGNLVQTQPPTLPSHRPSEKSRDLHLYEAKVPSNSLSHGAEKQSILYVLLLVPQTGFQPRYLDKITKSLH